MCLPRWESREEERLETKKNSHKSDTFKPGWSLERLSILEAHPLAKTGSGSSLCLPTRQEYRTCVAPGEELPPEDQNEHWLTGMYRPWLEFHWKSVGWTEDQGICHKPSNLEELGRFVKENRAGISQEMCVRLIENYNHRLQAVIQLCFDPGILFFLK